MLLGLADFSVGVNNDDHDYDLDNSAVLLLALLSFMLQY